MNLEKLEVGMIVKNYKEMCGLLGQSIQDGNSKKYQLKDWERYFKYHKQGHKFIVEEIYSDPIDKEETRGRKSIYGDMVQVLLMDLLSRNDGHLIISKTRLTKQLGLVNNNYSLGFGNQPRLSNLLNIGIDYINDFYAVNNNSLSKTINNALSSLQNKRLIDYSMVTMVKYQNDEKPHIATAFDRAILTEVDKEAMICLGIKSMEEIDNSVRNEKYYNFTRLRNNLIKEKTQIELVYKAFDIVVNKKHIETEKEDLSIHIINKLERQGKLKELNKTFSNKIIENANNRHENFGASEKTMLIRYSDVYVPYFKEMVNTLINVQANDITFEEIKQSTLSEEQLQQISELF